MQSSADENGNEFALLHEKFRTIKHSINNSLAVIMALSELSQRNPSHYEKLVKAVLNRSPDIVHQLQDFSTILSEKAKQVTAHAA
jgi:DNA-binding ferritin-like protein